MTHPKYLDPCTPLFFKSNYEKTSYFGKGSSFFVSNKKNIYWVTAAHAIENLKISLENYHILSSPESRISIPFDNKYRINTDDSVLADLFVMRVNTEEFDKYGDQPLVSHDIEIGVRNPDELPTGSKLQAVGFPDEYYKIDYETNNVKYTVSPANGLLKGRLNHPHYYQMEITDPRLENFNGMSGGPVFYMEDTFVNDELIVMPRLVGISIRAVENKTISFISSSVLLDVINSAESV